MRDARYLYQPYEVSLETLALCNAACTFCPYETLERKGVELSSDIITHIVAQMMQFEYPFFFSPFKVNEPFLDKRLFEILRAVNDNVPLARVRLFSNGSRLDMGTCAEIATLKNVAHVWVSLNSTIKIEHEKLMGFKQFNTIMHNLDNLHRLKKFPHTVALSRVTQGNPEDITFIEHCRQRWPKFLVQMIKRDGWLGYIDPQFVNVPDSPCARWWELSICADGKAALCCMDACGEHSIGSVYKSTLHELYNQPALLRRRMGLLNRRDVENKPCNQCTY